LIIRVSSSAHNTGNADVNTFFTCLKVSMPPGPDPGCLGNSCRQVSLIVVEYAAPTNQRYRDERRIKTRLSGQVIETLQDKYKRIWREITMNAENNTKSILNLRFFLLIKVVFLNLILVMKSCWLSQELFYP
jgi:hypothetical protein